MGIGVRSQNSGARKDAGSPRRSIFCETNPSCEGMKTLTTNLSTTDYDNWHRRRVLLKRTQMDGLAAVGQGVFGHGDGALWHTPFVYRGDHYQDAHTTINGIEYNLV